MRSPTPSDRSFSSASGCARPPANENEIDVLKPLASTIPTRSVAVTIRLYESGPAVKLGTSHLISIQAGLTDPRIVDGIEQRSLLYGLLSWAKDSVRWEAAPAAQFDKGVVTRPA